MASQGDLPVRREHVTTVEASTTEPPATLVPARPLSAEPCAHLAPIFGQIGIATGKREVTTSAKV